MCHRGLIGRRRFPGLVVPTLAVVAAAACGGSDWVEITGARAPTPDARAVLLLLDECHPAQEFAPTESVLESSSEIRVTLAMRFTSGDRDDCAGFATIELEAAIGSRSVVDVRTGRRFDVAFGTPEGAPPPATTSSGPDASSSSSPQSDTGSVQYAAVFGDAPLRSAVDPPADSPLVAVERPPLEWWAEYGSEASVAFRLSSHAAGFGDTINALEEIGFVSQAIALERGPAIGGSFEGDTGAPVLVVIENGSSTLLLVSYELDLVELTAVAARVENVDRATWLALGGVIE